jgi:hypothetical protein
MLCKECQQAAFILANGVALNLGLGLDLCLPARPPARPPACLPACLPAVCGMDLRVYWEAEQEWRVGTVVNFDLERRQAGLWGPPLWAAAGHCDTGRITTSSHHCCQSPLAVSLRAACVCLQPVPRGLSAPGAG